MPAETMTAREEAKLGDKSPQEGFECNVGRNFKEARVSDLSEEDIPLTARLSSQIQTQRNTGREKEEVELENLSRNKKGGFVIPRKKKQAKELLQKQSLTSREGKELLRNVQQSLRDPISWPTYKFEKVEFVHNEKLSREFREKKQAMRLETRAVEDKFAFSFTPSRTEVIDLLQNRELFARETYLGFLEARSPISCIIIK